MSNCPTFCRSANAPDGMEFAEDWAWAVPSAFRPHLGITWSMRTKGGVKSKSWEKTSDPKFDGGEILYSHASAYSDAPSSCYAVQIEKAFKDSVQFRWYVVDEHGAMKRVQGAIQGMSNAMFVRLLQYGPTTPPP